VSVAADRDSLSGARGRAWRLSNCHNGQRSMAETPQERYDRLRRTVQDAILSNYPNPNRQGCPEIAMIREVAFREELTKDEAWEHITHCSPCYADFLRFKEEWRTSRRSA
jgi:hypothetical protein